MASVRRYNGRVEAPCLTIFKYGSDVLSVKAADVKHINEAVVELARRMTETMHRTPGVGLAAPQVGESLKLATVDISIGENPEELLILINPVIVEADGGELDDEGCLSVPGYTLPIKRHNRLLLQFHTLEGKEVRQEFSGFKARVIQHEVDHLNGILILDRVSALKRNLIRREIKKLKKSGQW